jgi:hypothetical protein
MAIDTVVEEVADNLEEMAEVTRRINTTTVGYFLTGVAVGFGLGFYWGYKFNKEKIKAEAFKESEKEVKKIRDLYAQKTVAATPKPTVEEVIEERGYDRPLPPPVPGIVEPPVVSEKDKDRGWDYAEEIEKRVKGEPYVIHQDEFMQNAAEYTQVAYTYYAADDVLVDEENGHPLPHADLIVGVNNLKFGHGTDDNDVVFVQNDHYELIMEICRSPESYEEKFLGIENSDEPDDDED